MKKVIELIRVSTAQQAGDDRASIPAQRVINRKTAAAHGLTIIKSVEMSDVSGSNVLNAPEMKDLLREIQRPDIHGVVAREFSRLMRPENLGDFILLQHFADSKTLLYLPEGPMDFASKTGRLMGTIRAAIAGLEKSEFLERSWGAREEMRQQGKCASAPHTLPFGVTYNKLLGKFSYTSDAEVVRRLFESVASGVTTYSKLEKQSGLSRWNIRSVLMNPLYIGWRVYDKKRDMSPEGVYVRDDGRQAGRRKCRRPEEEIIRVKVIDNPLVPEALFKRVGTILDHKATTHYRNREGYTPHWKRFVYLGFLFCESCNAVLYSRSTTVKEGDRYDYYQCANRKQVGGQKPHALCPTRTLNRSKIETELDGVFANRLSDKNFIAAIAEKMLERHSERTTVQLSADRLRDQANKLENKRERVLELFIDGDITKAEREKRLLKIDQDLMGVQDELTKFSNQRATLDPRKLALMFAPLREWHRLNSEQKRALLTSMSPQIKVTDDYQVVGVSVPTLGEHQPFGDYVNRRTAGHLNTKDANRLYLPLIV